MVKMAVDKASTTYKPMGKPEAWFRIVRPPIVFISIFGALVGALNVTIAQGVDVNAGSLILTILGAGLLSAGLMVHNDFTDLESDRVNRPHKPIPRGIISPETAKYTGIGMMVVSIIVGFFINIFEWGNGFSNSDLYTPFGLNLPCGILTFVVVVVGIFYNKDGKYTGLTGHVLVAFGVGVIPYWGAIAVEPTDLVSMLPLALSIFVMEIGREIMVCAGDIKGDIEAGYKTTPIKMGRLNSIYFVLIFYLGFLPIYPISYFGWFGFPKIFGEIYLAGATLFAAILFLTWADTLRVAKKGDDDLTWQAFERNIRTGTRVGVIFFQVILFIEVFY
jgi:geranylgeranylglycerol-phosphate geranylgeranyltransferase